jgi:hypothetical protein
VCVHVCKWEIYQHRHKIQKKRILWWGVKREKHKWICCDFVITMGADDCASKELWSSLCGEKQTHILFSFHFFYTIILR